MLLDLFNFLNKYTLSFQYCQWGLTVKPTRLRELKSVMPMLFESANEAIAILGVMHIPPALTPTRVPLPKP